MAPEKTGLLHYQIHFDSMMRRLRKERLFIFMAMALFIGNQLLDKILIHNLAYGDPQTCRLDCIWYSGIAEHGYSEAEHGSADYTIMQNWAFFPLFPIAIFILNKFHETHIYTASTLASKSFLLLSIYLFIKLSQLYLHPVNPLIPGLVVAFNPYSIYANSGYTEPLFLGLTSLFFIELAHKKFVPAGLVGALLSATRLVGISALLALATQLWCSKKDNRNKSIAKSATALALVPTGLIFYCIHLRQKTGDPLAFIHIQTAWRGASSALTPLGWIESLVRGLMNDSLWLYRYWAVSGIIVVATSFFFLLRPGKHANRYRPLAIFSLASTLLPLSSDCWGLSRYIWWQAPLLLAVTALLKRFRLSFSILAWLSISIPITILCYREWFTRVNWYIS